MKSSARWTIEYFATDRGTSPIEEFLSSLPARERARATLYIELLRATGVSLGSPHARQLQDQLWELRPGSVRIIYFADSGRRFVLVHAFKKQTPKTPRRHIEIAFNRMNDYLRRNP